MSALKLLRSPRFGVGEWWALFAAIAYAITNVLTRVGAVNGDPLAGTIIRLIPLVVFSLGMMFWRRQHAARLLVWRNDSLGWRVVGWLVFYSVVVQPLAQLALFLSLRYGGVLVAVPIFSTFPLFGALIAIPFLNETFNKQIGIGIITSLVGITLLTYGQYSGSPISQLWPLGAFFALVAGITWGMSANLSGYLLRRGLDIYTLLAITTSISIVILAFFLLLFGRLEGLIHFPWASFQVLLLAGLLTGVAQFALFTAFALTTVASAGTIKTLDVVIAAVIAVWFLNELMNLPVSLGLILIMMGVIAVQLARAAPSQKPSTAMKQPNEIAKQEITEPALD